MLALTVRGGLTTRLLLSVVAVQMGLQVWLIGSWVTWRIARRRRRQPSEASSQSIMADV